MVPPAALTIEEEKSQFYTALGIAITNWQSVEAALGLLFWMIAGGEASGLSANAAFHAVFSFDAKLHMTHSAVISSWLLNSQPWKDGLKAEWNALHNRLARRNSRRNTQVHFSMVVHKERKAGHRVVLQPSALDLTARWRGPLPSLNTCQIAASGESFVKLSSDVLQFNSAALRFLVPMRASLLQAQRTESPLPTSHLLQVPDSSNDHCATERGAPPSPSQG